MTQSYEEAVGLLPIDKATAVQFARSPEGHRTETALTPLVTWCNELLRVKNGNPANFFLVGAYSEIVYITALLPLSLYR